MLYVKPDYYDFFRCVADQCEDTCCAGWQIVVDEDSLKRYREEKGPFRKRLQRGVSWRKKVFCQSKNKRCAFLNDQNLCDMYSALGESSLCITCNRYPRHIEEFEGVREQSLSLSCPEVAKYLMSREKAVEFICEENNEEESCSDYADMDFDLLLYDILEEGRNMLQKIFQNRTKNLKDRCEKAIHLASDIEDKIQQGEAFSCQEIFDIYENGQESYQKRRLCKSMEFSTAVMVSISRLERLREDWEASLSECSALLYLNGDSHYHSISREFDQWQKDVFQLEIPMEQLAVYYLTTYFCGAVYDGKILAKVQSTVLFLYVIYELCKAKWWKNERSFDQEDLYEIVYRFSRELEHSDRNLELFEKIAAAAMPVKTKK